MQYPEIDMSLFTGITLFNQKDVDQNDSNETTTTTTTTTTTSTTAPSSPSPSSSKGEKMKKWFDEYYYNLIQYHSIRKKRLEEFREEINNPTASPMSKEEKKTLESEHFQKETAYLRLKRKTIQQDFEPLFIYSSIKHLHNLTASSSPSHSSSSGGGTGDGKKPSPKQLIPLLKGEGNNKQVYRKSGTFAATALSPQSPDAIDFSIKKHNNNNNNNNNNNTTTSTTTTTTPSINNNNSTVNQGYLTTPTSPMTFNNLPVFNNQGGTIISFSNSPTGSFEDLSKPLSHSSGGGEIRQVRFSSDTDSIPTSPTSSDTNDPRGSVRRTKSISSITKDRGGLQSYTPTPLKNKSYTMQFKIDPKVKLEQTEKLLLEKEEDTRVAAEIGKTLLERVEELEIELTKTKSKEREQQRLLENMQSIADENGRLKTEILLLGSKVDSASIENAALLEKESHLNDKITQQHMWLRNEYTPMRSRTINQQKEEIENLKISVDHLQAAEDKLKKNRDRLASQNEQLTNSVADLQLMLREKVDQRDFEDLKKKMKDARAKNRELRARISELEESNSGSALALAEPEVFLRSAFNDLLKNEELINSTPKIANLRVLSDAKIMLGRLESIVQTNSECSLITTLVNFLEQEVNNDESNRILTNNLLSLNDSFDSNTDEKPKDPQSALYMLICIVSIHKYTKYDKKRLEGDNGTIEELGNQVETLKKVINNLEFNLGEAKLLNQKLEEDIDLLKTPRHNGGETFMSMADELKSSGQVVEQAELDRLRQQYEKQIVELDQLQLSNSLEIESLKFQLEKRSQDIQELQSKLDKVSADLTAEKESIQKDTESLLQEKRRLEESLNKKNEELDETQKRELSLLEQLSNEKSKSQSNLHDIESQLANQKAELEKEKLQLSQSINQLVSEINSLKENQQALELTISTLQQENDSMKLQAQTLNDSITREQQENQSLKSQMEQLKNDHQEAISKLNTHITTLESTVKQITTELNNALQQKEKDQAEIEKWKNDNNLIQQEKQQLQHSLDKLKDDNNTLTNDKQQLQQSLDKSKNDNNSLENDKKQLQQSLDKSNLDKQQLEKEKKQFTERLLSSEKIIKALRKEIKKRDKLVHNGNSEKDSIIQKLRNDYEESNNKKNSLLAEHIVAINALTAQIKSLQSQNQQLQDNRDSLSSIVSESNKVIMESVDKTKEQCEQSIDQANKRIQSLVDMVSMIVEKMHREKEAQEKTKVDLEHWKEKANQLIVDLENEKENTESLTTENLQLKEQIKELQLKLENKTRKHKSVKELSMQLTDMMKLVQQKKEQKEAKKEKENTPIIPPDNLEKTYECPEEPALLSYINQKLKPNGDYLDHIMPLDLKKHILCSIYDGVLLCELVNFAKEGTIDERVMNIKPKNQMEIDQNFNLVTNSARAIGCKFLPGQKLTPQSIRDDPLLALSLIYELVRVQIMSSISVVNYPNLLLLKTPDEEVKHFLALSTAQLLQRWVIYNLDSNCTQNNTNLRRSMVIKAKVQGSVEDLILDENNTIKLLCNLDKELVDPSITSTTTLEQEELYQWIINESTNRFNIFPWLSIQSFLNKHSKLALLFVTSLFISPKGVSSLNLPPSKDGKESSSITKVVQEVKSILVDVDGTREERAFCMWLNSLDVNPYVNNLQQDLQDGLILLQMFDKIKPGCVNWSKVNQNPSNAYKELENCNYAISLARQFNFSMVNVGGKDINDGQLKLTLGLIWQACKYHLLSILQSLWGPAGSSKGGSNEVTEADIIKWANQKVTTIGKSSGINNFKDPSIGSGLFLIDLLESVCEGCVNYSIVHQGETNDEKKANAQYIINVARKLDCCIFLVWEDIVQVRPKMILTLVAQLYIKSEGLNDHDTDIEYDD